MDNQKLKLKIGDHEFEAEGPHEVVQAQFKAFQELVLKVITTVPSPQTYVNPTAQKHEEIDTEGKDVNSTPDDELDQIMKLDKKIVSLTVHTENVDDAIMLLMYGQKMFRDSSSVTGAEIMSGLKMSGRNELRVDRNLKKAGDEGDIIVIGQRRAKRYRLTNKGLARARKIAEDRIAIVA